MKNIITAINSTYIIQKLEKENINILNKNICYREGIIEALEKYKNVDFVLIEENIPGDISIVKIIEKILKIDNKIIIIFLAKKQNEDIKKIKKEKIKIIYYEKKINYSEIKKYINSFEYIKDKNKKNEIINKEKKESTNEKCKTVFICGERKVGKSLIGISFLSYLNSKNKKTLLVELNAENPSILKILNLHNNKKCVKNNRIKDSEKKIKGYKVFNYNNRYKESDYTIIKNILNKIIIKINNNLYIIPYNKIIKFKYIKILEKDFNYIIIENIFLKYKNNNLNLIIIEPNIIEIEKNIKIIKKNNFKNKNNLKIILNKYTKYSIDEKIIKNIFNKNEILGKINYKKEYEKLINTKQKNKILLFNNYDEEVYKIANKIF